MRVGGGQIADFSITLLLGIIFGTYSSIYISVPLVLYLDNYLQRRSADKREQPGGAPGTKKGGKPTPPSPGDDKKARAPA